MTVYVPRIESNWKFQKLFFLIRHVYVCLCLDLVCCANNTYHRVLSEYKICNRYQSNLSEYVAKKSQDLWPDFRCMFLLNGNFYHLKSLTILLNTSRK